MANLKEVKERIGSVVTTKQITSAMKLVAASKLRRAQGRITQMRPYADKLYGILGNLMASTEGENIDLNFNEEREPNKVLIVLLTSDKGLCGGFNANLVKTTKALLKEKYAEQNKSGNVTLMTLGKKGFDAFKKEGIEIKQENQDIFNHLTFDDAGPIAQHLMDAFLNGEYDVIEVVYARFKNAATQFFEAEQFLPIAQLEAEEDEATSNIDFIYEPAKEELIQELVPKILKTQFYRYLLDSNASEHGARMVAMDKASENADELLKELKLLYNRERQAAITKEILEIVGGAAALEEG